MATEPGMGPESLRATEASAHQPSSPLPAHLPRLFTVELRRDGSLFADGGRLGAMAELGPLAHRSATRGAFSGAVVFAERAPDRRRLVELLQRQGFAQVQGVERAAPRELAGKLHSSMEMARALPSAGVGGGSTVPSTRPTGVEQAGPGTAAPSQRPVATASAVQLVSVGLHVGGAPKDERNRQRLVRLFESKFDSFRTCHRLARDRSDNALFAVDVAVPTLGGKGKVREVRTRLAGDGFQACMLQVFQGIRFPPPPTGRPEMVSYSLLFKPAAP
jgi:hypothetical protein